LSNFGSAEFGPAVFGGDPLGPTGLLFEIDAELTTTARMFLARGTIDGTSFQVREFTVGYGGLDPFDYKMATAVNPSATDLEQPITLPIMPIPGTLSVANGSDTISTSDDLKYVVKPGDLIEVTTGTGVQIFTVQTVTINSLTVTTDSANTDAAATGVLYVEVAGAKYVSVYERPNHTAACCYCTLPRSIGTLEPLSEIALWAKIICSPITAEVGNWFVAAIGHFPIQCKNDTMQYALRVNVQF